MNVHTKLIIVLGLSLLAAYGGVVIAAFHLMNHHNIMAFWIISGGGVCVSLVVAYFGSRAVSP